MAEKRRVLGKLFAPPFLLTQAFVLSQLPAELQFQQNYIEASESKVLDEGTKIKGILSFTLMIL